MQHVTVRIESLTLYMLCSLGKLASLRSVVLGKLTAISLIFVRVKSTFCTLVHTITILRLVSNPNVQMFIMFPGCTPKTFYNSINVPYSIILWDVRTYNEWLCESNVICCEWPFSELLSNSHHPTLQQFTKSFLLYDFLAHLAKILLKTNDICFVEIVQYPRRTCVILGFPDALNVVILTVDI